MVNKLHLLLMLWVVNVCSCRAEDTNVCGTSCNVDGSITVKGKEGMKGEKGEKGDPGTSCECKLQDPNKPSAHMEAENLKAVTYQKSIVITNWDVSAPYSHLAGGMTYQDGKLTVPTPGRYYIYTQLYYHSTGRVYVNVNNHPITMIQPPTSGGSHGTLYAGGVFNLKAGDVITLRANSGAKIYMYSFHSYFGAYLM